MAVCFIVFIVFLLCVIALGLRGEIKSREGVRSQGRVYVHLTDASVRSCLRSNARNKPRTQHTQHTQHSTSKHHIASPSFSTYHPFCGNLCTNNNSFFPQEK
jgi:hypothetical protein